MYIEDLTLVVISYEIYETSPRRVSWISYEMTTSVRFCLSYDCFKWELKSWDYFNTKHNIVTDGIMALRASNQVLCNVWSYDFYDMTLSTE